MPAISHRYRVLVSVALISVTVFAVFSSCLQFGYVNWDDDRNVIENTAIRSLSPASIRSIYTSFFIGHYEPLTMTIYALEYRYVKLKPFLYHLVNLALHVVNCLLVFWLFLLISKKISVSLPVALLFGIHPLQVQTVAWVSETKNVLYAFFYLWALICYVYCLRHDLSRKYLLFTFVLFFASLLSKSMAVTLPMVLVLFDFYFHKRITKRLMVQKIPFFSLSLIFSFIAIRGSSLAGCIRQEGGFDIFHRAGVACYALTFYINKIFIPTDLSCFYQYSLNRADHRVAMFIYSYLFISLLCGLVFIFRRHTKKIALGCLFFLITLMPVLQFVPVGETLVADHHLYLSLLGVIYLAAEGIAWLYERSKRLYAVRFILISGALSIIAMFAVLSWHRCQVWRDSASLWTDVITRYPDTTTAHNNRGVALLENQQFESAKDDFLAALRIDPLCPEAYVNLAGIYYRSESPEQAVRFLNKAIYVDPAYLRAYDLLVLVYQGMLRDEEVIKICRKEIEIDPRHALAYSNLANTLGITGDIKGAIEQCQKAILLEPNLASAHFTIAVAYYNAKQFDLAIHHCDKALSLGFKAPAGFIESLDPYRVKN